MPKPKICPCSKEIERPSFFIFIMVLDVLTQGIGGFLCGGAGLLIYIYIKHFNHWYFYIFSMGRLFIDIVIFILLVFLLIRYCLDFDDLVRYFHIDSNTKASVFFVILFAYYIWNIYLSYQFFIHVKYYQNNYNSENEIKRVNEDDIEMKENKELFKTNLK